MKKIDDLLSERIHKVPKSFIREILKVAVDPGIISFGGGLPNPDYFPVEEIKKATIKVLEKDGKNALQYATTEGYLPLREYIAKQYKIKKNIEVSPDEILITNGSQQALDLIGKVFINKNDNLLIEAPGYLGAIQAFSMYQPNFVTIPLRADGADVEEMQRALEQHKIKLFYAVPNFQNPSGISYTEEKRAEVAKVLQKSGTIFVEDDPYGELRFMGEHKSSMKSYLPDQVIMLGTFSKTVTPSLRIGWICAPKLVMEKLIIAKQASDLHTNYLSQRIVCQHLQDNDIDKHIEIIKKVYKLQRDKMVEMLKKYLPQEIKHTEPEGGMFLWLTIQKISLIMLLKKMLHLCRAFPFMLMEKELILCA
jgi:2-aminoadipate transaminase